MVWYSKVNELALKLTFNSCFVVTISKIQARYVIYITLSDRSCSTLLLFLMTQLTVVKQFVCKNPIF